MEPKDILKYDLCLGCGLCESMSKNGKMVLTKRGFYEPIDVSKKEFAKIKRVCPAISIINRNTSNQTIWGPVIQAYDAWSTDPDVRFTSSSGGVTSSLSIFMLEKGLVNGVLHVGEDGSNPLHNKLYVSRTKEEILSRNSSRYAPAAVFNEIFSILDSNKDEKFVFIGKPCDCSAMRNILYNYPEYKDNIFCILSIFCAGMPHYEATNLAINKLNKSAKVNHIRYRGNGWPGRFTVTYEDGDNRSMTYRECWRDTLSHHLPFRCKICPDGIGIMADIASGDSWNTKDGYPDMAEADGVNFCFIRTPKGKEIFEGAVKHGYIETKSLNIDNVKYQQRYQYDRRHRIGWRIGAVQLLTKGILKIKGMKIYYYALRTRGYRHSLKDAWGTIKRLKKASKQWQVQKK